MNSIDEILQSVSDEYGLTPRKIFEYAGLFCLVAIIYAIYLHGILTGPEEIDMGRVGRFCVISAVPFGLLAFFDASWQSRDAAPVALSAWVAVFLGFAEKWGGGCPPSAAFFFTPLVFSALVAHMLGAGRRRRVRMPRI